MSLLRDGPAAWERLLQQFKPRYARHGKLAPVRQAAAAALARDLIGEEERSSLLNAIIMRLYDSNLIEIGKAQQALLMNRREDALVNSRINIRWGGMPYYMHWASHRHIIIDIRPIREPHAWLY